MKKLLALVLALVMTLGLATVGTNAAFADQDAVDASEYWEAITVLNGMGVFKGYEDDEFKPEAKITRAQVAAIIYRIYTGDVDDESIANYVNLGNFSDVKPTDWYAGYVGYCANAKFIKGYGDGTFQPNREISGYEALAMILRAVGYNAQNDFEGAGYWVDVAKVAEQYNMLDNIKAEDLTGKAPRATIAEILFDAIKVPCVNWLPALGYQNRTAASIANNGAVNQSLAQKNFDLVGPADKTDSWGVLSRVWGTSTDDDAYATIAVKPSATYYTAVPECDVAHDVGTTATVVYDLYLNGRTDDGTTTASQTAGIIGVGDRDTDIDSITTTTGLRTNKVQIVPTATVATIGGQGRETLVYYKAGVNKNINRIVMVDTFLATVTNKADATYDRNNHLATPSILDLDVAVAGDAANAATFRNVRLTNGKTNYDFAVGDYVLFQAKTVAVAGNDNARMDNNRLNGGSATNFLFKTGTAIVTGVANEVASLKLVEKAASIEGSQTTVHFNDGKHEINNKLYNDAIELHLDEARLSTAKHTWFLDKHENIIGDVYDTPTSYAIIKDIQWINPVGGTGYARATLLTMDGKEIVTDASTTALRLGGMTFTAGAFGPLTYQAAAVNGNRVAGTVSTNYATNMVPNIGAALAYNGQELYQIAYPAALNGAMALIAGNQAAGTLPAGVTRTIQHADTGSGAATSDEVIIRTGISTLRFAEDMSAVVTVNSDTKFLIRTVDANTGAYDYKTVTGFENVPSYTNAVANGYAHVDYVMNRAGTYAEYVYITGVADSTMINAQDFVFITSASNATAAGVTKMVNGVRYNVYAVTGLLRLDGTSTTLNVLIPTNTVVANTETLQNGLFANRGKLFRVNLLNGELLWTNGNAFADRFTEVTGSALNENLVQLGSANAATRLEAQYVGAATLVTPGVVRANGNDYKILDSTNILTEDGTVLTKDTLTAAHLTGKGVYVVVYTAGAPTGRNLYTDAVALYITSPKAYAIDGGNDVTAAGIIAKLDALESEAAASGVGVASTLKLWGELNNMWAKATAEAKVLAQALLDDTTANATKSTLSGGTRTLKTDMGTAPGTPLTDNAGANAPTGAVGAGAATIAQVVANGETRTLAAWTATTGALTAATTDAALEAAWADLTDAQKAAAGKTLAEAKHDRDLLKLAADLDAALANTAGTPYTLITTAGANQANLNDAKLVADAIAAYNALTTAADKAAVLAGTATPIAATGAAPSIAAAQTGLGTYWDELTNTTPVIGTNTAGVMNLNDSQIATVWGYLTADQKTAATVNLNKAYTVNDAAKAALALTAATLNAAVLKTSTDAEVNAAILAEAQKVVNAVTDVQSTFVVTFQNTATLNTWTATINAAEGGTADAKTAKAACADFTITATSGATTNNSAANVTATGVNLTTKYSSATNAETGVQTAVGASGIANNAGTPDTSAAVKAKVKAAIEALPEVKFVDCTWTGALTAANTIQVTVNYTWQGTAYTTTASVVVGA